MTPAEQAAAVYEREACARSFREDLEAHLLNGYVFSTPTAFVMGRPVRHDADPALIVDPWHVFPEAEHTGWLVYLAAGSLREIVSFEPKPLDFFLWERENVLRCFYAATVKRLCSRSFSSSRFLPSPSFSGSILPPT